MAFPLQEYLREYATELEQSPLRVALLDSPADPSGLAAGSARTCYSNNGLITPQDSHERNPELSRKVLRNTLDSGHLTTRQHSQFVFAIEGISRHLIHDYLHAHPYYNSEQVSQRYTRTHSGKDWYSLPPVLQTRVVYEHMQAMVAAYENITTLLMQPAADLHYGRFRTRERNATNDRAVQKKTMEVARYSLPVSTTAYLYHTVSQLTLMRYALTIHSTGLTEQIVLVLKMLQAVLSRHPELASEFPYPMETDRAEVSPAQAERANNLFDESLQGKNARLLAYPASPDELLKLGWLSAVGSEPPSTEEILRALLSPEKNPGTASVLYPLTLDASSRILQILTFQFQKKISHTADSQAQRHRTIPGTRPNLPSQISLQTEFVTPALLQHSEQALGVYHDSMEKTFALIRSLFNQGISLYDLAYLIPNSFPVRYVESSDLLNLFHRFKTRLCFNAQEEIWSSTQREALSMAEVFPALEPYLAAPCALRHSIQPRCPEGSHYCGVKVWKIPLSEQTRVI